MMNPGHLSFVERRRIRLGSHEIVFSTIPAGVHGQGGVLPARGLLEAWVLTPRGDRIDTHRKYAAASWQGSAEELEVMAHELLALASLVRSNP